MPQTQRQLLQGSVTPLVHDEEEMQRQIDEIQKQKDALGSQYHQHKKLVDVKKEALQALIEGS